MDEQVDPAEVGVGLTRRALAVPVAWAMATALAAFVVAVRVYGIRYGNLGVPFAYGADGNLNGMAVKAMLEQGWPLANPRLGAPVGQQLYDFPFYDNLSMLAMKVLGVFSSRWPIVENTYFVLTFPAVGAAAWASFRRIGLRPSTSAALGLLYATAPYHFIRGEGHLFLSAYAVVPLSAALVLDVIAGRSLLGPRGRWLLTGRRTFTVATVVLTACAVQYYPVFAAMLLVIAALARLSATRHWRAAVPGVSAAAVLVVLFLVNLAPNLAYRAAHGANPSVGHRQLVETVAFSLRLTDLLLPLRQHRIAALGGRVQTYGEQLGGGVEAGSPALGIVASVGFVVLVLAVAPLMLRQRRSDTEAASDSAPPDQPTSTVGESLNLGHLSLLTVASFVLATTGGGAAILAFWSGSPIRAWNRLSIFLSFFCLAAVGLLVERAVAFAPRLWRNPALAVALLLVAAVGIFDQTSPAFAFDTGGVAALWARDERFVRAVEQRLGPDASILQLPYLSFPENGSYRGMLDYEPLRGYLHSKSARWSYGASRDRPADWQEGLLGAPAPLVAVAARVIGFDAAWIDRRGYPVTAEGVVTALSSASNQAGTLTSEEGAFTLVDLTGLEVVAGRATATLRRRLLAPIDPGFGAGFYPREFDDSHVWNWTTGSSVLHLRNPLREGRVVIVRVKVHTIDERPATVRAMLADGTTSTFAIAPGGSTVELKVPVSVGGTDVAWESDVAPAPQVDGRILALRFTDLSVLDEELGLLAAALGINVPVDAPVV